MGAKLGWWGLETGVSGVSFAFHLRFIYPSRGATPGSLAGGGRSRAEPLRHRAGASGRGGPAVDLGARRAGFR